MAITEKYRFPALPDTVVLREAWAVSSSERVLSEVDNIVAARLPDGSLPTGVEEDVLLNLITAIKEAAIPNAVSVVTHQRESRETATEPPQQAAFRWLGRTAIEHAESGYRYHRLPAARARVDVEVDEARATEESLRPGYTKVFLSPRMSRADASYDAAKAEHLADEDAVRITRAITDIKGEVRARQIESVLVRGVPLEAWVALLQDPNNIFGNSIEIDNPQSALSVMQVHRQLEVPDSVLQDGVRSLVQAVIPYIANPLRRAMVARQVEAFECDQAELHATAQSMAERWLAFEKELAASLVVGRASFALQRFIISLQDAWSKQEQSLLQNHSLANAEYKMTRELASMLERAQRNMLWTRAGAVVENAAVLAQLGPDTAQMIRANERAMLTYGGNLSNFRMSQEAAINRRIASHNVRVGGGCAGTSNPTFQANLSGSDSLDGSSENGELSSSDEAKIGKKKRGRCVVESCPTRPGQVIVGGCGVCLDRCQKLFDKGVDPTKMAPYRPASEDSLPNVKQLFKRLLPVVAADKKINAYERLAA